MSATKTKTLDEVLAESETLKTQVNTLTGDKTKLTAGATLPTDLVSAANELHQSKADLTTAKQTIGTLNGQVASTNGDKTKLVAGATMPTDLVTAANSIHSLTAENTTLKSEKETVEKAVAKALAKHGIVADTETPEQKAGDKQLTMTERVLAANGVKTLEELAAKRAKARA